MTLMRLRRGTLMRRALPPAPGAAWLTDNFNRADSGLSGTGPGWVAPSVYRIVDNAVQLNTTSGTHVAYLDTGSTNHEAYVKVQRNGGTSVGMTARYVDTTKSLGIRLNTSGGLGFFQTNSGTVVHQDNIVTVSSTTDWNELGLRIIEDTAEVFFNGALVYTFNPIATALRTGTAIGMRIAGSGTVQARYDDFRARPL